MAPPSISNDPEYIELVKFLIEKSKNAKSPLNMSELAREFMEKSGCSQKLVCLLNRICKFRSNIHQMDSIDTKTKLKMLFALSVPIDDNFLNELRVDADVEVDEKRRITKYEANDGSQEMEGDHSHSAKMREKQKRRRTGSENRDEDSDDEAMDPIPKTPGSTKRVTAAKVPSSTKRTRTGVVKSEDHAPDDTARTSESRAREVVRRFTPQPKSPKIQQLGQPKLEAAPVAPNVRSHQEVPRGTPGAHIPRANPIKTESGADNAFTPQIKFLEAIQSLVLNLDMPSFAPIQLKIEKMLRESSNAKIPNDIMSLALEMLVKKITHHSVSILPETVESVSLKVFLCYLKAAILNSKLEGLEVLIEKVKERINEPASKDKNIPVDKVLSVLQYTLDGI